MKCYSDEKRRKWIAESNPRWAGGEMKLKCSVCQKSFSSKRYGKRNAVVCSRDCYAKHRSDVYRKSKHPGWKGGTALITKPVRSLKAYRTWREKVLERDKHQCVDCGSSEKLHTHHIVELVKIVKDIIKHNGELIYTDPRLFDINNGKTLCDYCHRRIHKKTGRIAGTPHKVA